MCPSGLSITIGDKHSFHMIGYKTLFFIFITMQGTLNALEGNGSTPANWFDTMLLEADIDSDEADSEKLTLEQYLSSIGDMLPTAGKPIFDQKELKAWVDYFLDSHQDGIFNKRDLKVAIMVAQVIHDLEPLAKLRFIISKALGKSVDDLMIERPKEFFYIDSEQ